MTRTPDEIKKGLECLDKMQFFMGQRAGRELWNEKPHDVQEQDLEQYNRDVEKVRALIQQLEAELSDAKNNHQHTIDIAEGMKSQIEKLKKVVVRLNTELDEAVETIKRMACCGADCGGCVHLKEEPDQICIDLDFDCERCKEQCACYRCKDGSNYEWHGAQKN